MKRHIHHYNHLIRRYQKYQRKYNKELQSLKRRTRLAWIRKRLQKIIRQLQSFKNLKKLTAAGMTGLMITASGLVSAQDFSEKTGMENPLNLGLSNRTSVSFGDVDGDGDQDAFVVNNGSLLFYRNDGTATSPSFTPITGTDNPFDDITIGSSSFAIADLDGDGDLDFLQAEDDGTQGSSRYYKNNGTATNADLASSATTLVSLSDISVLPPASLESIEPTLADIDGDSDLDLIVSTVYTEQVYVGYECVDPPECYVLIPEFDYVPKGKVFYYKNEGSNTSPSFSLISDSSNPFGEIPSDISFLHVAISDLDRDSDPDAIVADGSDIHEYVNLGAGMSPVFIEGLEFQPTSSFDDPILSFVDIDADGDEDIFIGENDGDIRFFENITTARLFGLTQDGAASLHWQASDRDNLSHYNIYGRALNSDTKIGEVAVGTTSFVDSPLDNGAIGFYTVTTVDNEGNESDYSLEEGVVANGSLGNSISFGNNGGFIEVPDRTALRTPIGTIEFWMKMSTLPTGNSYSIIGKHASTGSLSGWNITHGTETLAVQIKDGDTGITNMSSESNLSDDNWHHVALSFQLDGASESILYVDGVAVSTLETSPKITITNQSMRMGKSLDNFWADFPGQLEEVRFWDHVRSAEEIATSRRKILSGDTDGLLAYWSFDEPVDQSTTYDGGRNGNNGTVGGGANFAASDGLNAAPVVANEISDLTLTEGFISEAVDLTQVFQDSNGDALLLSTVSANEEVATVSLSGNLLTLTEVALGSAEITVTANDQFGGKVSDSFMVLIEAAPVEPEEPVITSVDEGEFTEFILYPNPTRNYLNIKLGAHSRAMVTIYSLLGNVILRRENIDQDHVRLDLSNFEKGVYLLLAESNSGLIKRRILVE